MHRGIAFADWEKSSRTAKDTSPIVTFAGPESFFFEAGIALLEERSRKRGMRCERISLWGGDVDVSRVFGNLNTCPMSTDLQLITVRRFEESSAKEMKHWSAYCTAPAEWNVLILQITESDKVQESFAKLIEKHGIIVNASRVKPREMAGWVQKGLKARGRSGDGEACSALALRAGTDLTRLRSEVEKVSLYVGQRKEVRIEDVEAVGSLQNDASIFALDDAVSAGNLMIATTLARQILASGESVQSLLSNLAWHIRRLMKSRDVLSRGGSASDVGRATGVPSYFLEKLMDQAQRSSTSDLRRQMEVLAEWDFRLKRSLVPNGVIPELLMSELLGKGAGAAPH